MSDQAACSMLDVAGTLSTLKLSTFHFLFLFFGFAQFLLVRKWDERWTTQWWWVTAYSLLNYPMIFKICIVSLSTYVISNNDCLFTFNMHSHLFKHAGRVFGHRRWHKYHSSCFRIRYRYATSSSCRVRWIGQSCRFNRIRAQVSIDYYYYYCYLKPTHIYMRSIDISNLIWYIHERCTGRIYGEFLSNLWTNKSMVYMLIRSNPKHSKAHRTCIRSTVNRKRY